MEILDINKNNKSICLEIMSTPTIAPAPIKSNFSNGTTIKNRKGIESLKGPIVIQTLVQYSFFLIIIGAAERSEWSPNIRVANFLPYCIICILLLEVNRLQTKPLMRVIFLLYSSNIPFCYMVIFSREAHVLVALLFFVSCLCIFLQSGIQQLRKHILCFIVIVMINYIACLLFMDWFYVDDTGMNPYRGKTLSTKIHWGEEITILLSMSLLGTSFIVLEKFIKSYANCLLEQYNQIKTLEKEKEKLEIEIQSIYNMNNNKLDLGTPIDKIIYIIRDMINSSDSSENNKSQLCQILTVLSSHKLYDPIFNIEKSSNNDQEVFSWLQSMINSEFNDNKSNNNQILEINQFSPPQHTYSSNKLDQSKYLLLQADPEKMLENDIFELLKKNINNWDFPIFELGEISKGNPLFYASYYIFSRHKIFQKFQINELVFRKFITTIESGYDSLINYHNSLHATDVLLTLNYFIENGLGKYLTDVDIFSMLMAAIIHDYKHNGVSNSFHNATKSNLSLKYNDQSVLENHHLSQSFKVIYSPIVISTSPLTNSSNSTSLESFTNISTSSLESSIQSTSSSSLQQLQQQQQYQKKEYFLLENLSENLKKEFRDNVISLVLSTDMANHFDLVGKFKSKLSALGGVIPIPSNINGQNEGGIDKKDKRLLMQIAMKAADISNPTKSFNDIYSHWVTRITEEFYRQGDEERKRNMDVSAFMDRLKPNSTPKCQISFINLFVQPLYDVLSTQFPEFDFIHKNIKNNLLIWESSELNNSSCNNTSNNPIVSA